MRARIADLADACGGRVVGDPDAVVDRATQDSREVRPGSLFVALQGERDGHDFVPAAVAAGAAACLVERELGAWSEPGAPAGPAALIVVPDAGVALTDLGRWARAQLPERVVGVTGSVGKTSTKDLLAAVLATTLATHASHKSFNNEIGVPLTLLNPPEGTEVVVVEMGARGSGHIAHLCRIARPTVAVVTAVAHAHTELFGTIDDVAVAKGELVEALPPHGLAVLNADDHRVEAMAQRTDATVVTYGTNGEVRAEDLALDDELRPRFRLVSPWGSVGVAMQVRGAHMAQNALAAAAVGASLGVPLDAVAAGLAGAGLSPQRMAVSRTPAGTLVIDDSYNANPASMEAALDALAALRVRRRVAVLGLMAELGEVSAPAHAEVARVAAELGVQVLAVGTHGYGPDALAGVDEAVAALRSLDLGPHDAVLVKGSRVAGLERVAAALLAG